MKFFMGGNVPLLGSAVSVRYADCAYARLSAEGVLLVPGENTPLALERWYRRQAKQEIAARLAVATEHLQVHYQRLTIRDQRTRWGSCSSRGTLSFNWRLMLGPSEVLTYVVWHEACHLRIANHSRSFWQLLASVYPQYREAKDWLHQYGHLLLTFQFGSDVANLARDQMNTTSMPMSKEEVLVMRGSGWNGDLDTFRSNSLK